MPLYEYHCNKCGDTIEKLVPAYHGAKKHMKCNCGGRLERLIGGSNLKFKGGGWSQDYTPRARK